MTNKDIIQTIFNEPKIIALVGDTNSGKSNTLYWIINTLREAGSFNLYTYGLRTPIEDATEIYSTGEVEQITNSLVVLDEVMTMWNLDDRKNKRSIENSLRLIHHNNNILLLSMLPENLKKFIASKVNTYIFKRCTIPDFINGSVAKRLVESYAGPERGSVMLNLPHNQAMLYMLHFFKFEVPYMRQYDTKLTNEPIINLSLKTSKKTSHKTSEKVSQLHKATG